VKRSVVVSLGSFAREALAAVHMNGSETATSVVRAIRVYLNDKDSGEPGWAYPSLRRERQQPTEGGDLELRVDEDLWQQLEEEAVGQRVTPQQLIEHAVLYFTAEIDAGRITRRILEDVGEE
jgi:hypothetical protein